MQIVSAKQIGEISEALFALLGASLSEGKKVFWLVSGGSSLPIAAEVSKRLQQLHSTRLFVTLVDDKLTSNMPYGSNWQQLLDLGFDNTHIPAMGIVRPGHPLEELSRSFEETLSAKLTWADVVIGQFGIGADYHTGGILPNSPAAKETEHLAIGYEHGGEGKITITPAVIRQLDVVFINSMGKSKRGIVAHFIESEEGAVTEPAQNLKHAKESYLYSDVLPT